MAGTGGREWKIVVAAVGVILVMASVLKSVAVLSILLSWAAPVGLAGLVYVRTRRRATLRRIRKRG